MTSPELQYQELQAEYDRLFTTEPIRDEDRGYRWLAEQLFLRKKNIARLLDVACGGGFFLRQAFGVSSKSLYLGVDLSGKGLEIARKELPKGRFLLSLGETLPFKSESIDAITCLGSLEHFLDIPKALREMKRVLSKDGVLLVLVPNLFWYKDLLAVFFTGDRKERNQTHEKFALLEEWRRILESEGLSVTHVAKYNGIAKSKFKQWLKDCLIPLNFSYHFAFFCQRSK